MNWKVLRRTGGARCEPRWIRNWMVGQSVDAERQSSCSLSICGHPCTYLVRSRSWALDGPHGLFIALPRRAAEAKNDQDLRDELGDFLVLGLPTPSNDKHVHTAAVLLRWTCPFHDGPEAACARRRRHGHHADGWVRLLSPGTGRGDQEPQKSELSLIEWPPCPCFRNARSLCASVDRSPRRRPCHLAQQRLECAWVPHLVNCGGNSFASHQLHFLCFWYDKCRLF